MHRVKNPVKLIPFFILLLIFSANPPWFLWSISYYIVTGSALILFLLQIKRYKKITLDSLSFLILYFIAFIFFIILKGYGEIRGSSIVFFITLFSCYFLKTDEKIKTVNLFSKTYALILGVSLVFWLIHNFLYSLPFGHALNYSKYLGKGEDRDFYNYIFFIQPRMDYIRFYSVFDEPGVVGTLSAFVLFAQRYNFKKWYNLVILIASIFTFSLAFYLLSFIGLLSVSIIEKRFKFLIYSILSTILSLALLSTLDSFRLVVLNRLNNIGGSVSERTGIFTNQLYDEVIQTIKIFYGVPLNYLKENSYLIEGQSYKFFIIEYGLIGALLIFSIYFHTLLKNKSFLGFILLLVFIISFIQRPFLFTPWQIILFTLLCSYLKDSRNIDQGANHS